jgi:hypothetical protein
MSRADCEIAEDEEDPMGVTHQASGSTRMTFSVSGSASVIFLEDSLLALQELNLTPERKGRDVSRAV